MALDPNPALRTELLAALAVLAPQIRGLQDLAATPAISASLRGEVENQITARIRRRNLIQSVLDGLDAALGELSALEADGYPALPATPIPGGLFSELQTENSDIEAAVAIFATEKIAAGPLSSTPNPAPPSKPGP